RVAALDLRVGRDPSGPARALRPRDRRRGQHAARRAGLERGRRAEQRRAARARRRRRHRRAPATRRLASLTRCMAQQTTPREAVERLRQAWRGEVQARQMYLLLAERMGDSRRGEIIRAIADAEASHRQRIEKRLRELGQTVPDPSTVNLSVIQRLQARLAPVETVIAHMEAAEELEITDRYKRPTGDADTDAVLEEIRVEEQGHSRSLESTEVAHRAAPAPSSVQSRLNRILGRESWHRTGAGWISGAIYGANDGLAA